MNKNNILIGVNSDKYERSVMGMLSYFYEYGSTRASVLDYNKYRELHIRNSKKLIIDTDSYLYTIASSMLGIQEDLLVRALHSKNEYYSPNTNNLVTVTDGNIDNCVILNDSSYNLVDGYIKDLIKLNRTKFIIIPISVIINSVRKLIISNFGERVQDVNINKLVVTHHTRDSLGIIHTNNDVNFNFVKGFPKGYNISVVESGCTNIDNKHDYVIEVTNEQNLFYKLSSIFNEIVNKR